MSDIRSYVNNPCTAIINELDSPEAWIKNSRKLMHSAKVIFKESQTLDEYLKTIIPENGTREISDDEDIVLNGKLGSYSIYLMLISFAFENLLKGLGIAKYNMKIKDLRITNRKYKGKNYNGHQLVFIVNEILNKQSDVPVLILSETETKLFEKLSIYSEKARYPAIDYNEQYSNHAEEFKNCHNYEAMKVISNPTALHDKFNPKEEIPLIEHLYEKIIALIEVN
jgi:hypothetical protein